MLSTGPYLSDSKMPKRSGSPHTPEKAEKRKCLNGEEDLANVVANDENTVGAIAVEAENGLVVDSEAADSVVISGDQVLEEENARQDLSFALGTVGAATPGHSAMASVDGIADDAMASMSQKTNTLRRFIQKLKNIADSEVIIDRISPGLFNLVRRILEESFEWKNEIFVELDNVQAKLELYHNLNDSSDMVNDETTPAALDNLSSEREKEQWEAQFWCVQLFSKMSGLNL